jgi:ATP-binding cassette subfamily D (ALD) protein 3
MGIFDSMTVKYGAVLCGYTILGLPVFKKGALNKFSPNEMASNITKDYIKNSSLLINLAKVI